MTPTKQYEILSKRIKEINDKITRQLDEIDADLVLLGRKFKKHASEK